MAYIADQTLNLNSQALALLAILASTKLPDGLRSETGAWYNGRERGVWIQVAGSIHDKALNIVFCECRNGDTLTIDTWLSAGCGYLNPPSSRAPEYETAYQNRKHIPYGRLDLALAYILNLIRNQFQE